MIPLFRFFVNCAALFRFDHLFYLPQADFREVCGGSAEAVDRVRGTEFIHTVECFGIHIGRRMVARTGQDGECHAVFQDGEKANPQIVRVVLRKQTSVRDGGKVVEVVSERILAEVSDSGENGGRKGPFLRQFPEPVLHRFGDRLLHPVLHRPEFKRTAAVRVCHIENMGKNRSPSVVPDERNTVCATVDPSVQTVPDGNLGAGNGVRLLRIDTHLIRKRILILPRRRPQECHPVPPAPGNGFHRLAVQIGDQVCFS